MRPITLTMPPSADAPILVLDSGLGGLTVVRAIRSRLPRERILYFGDTARVPYGSKTPRTVTSFVRQIISYIRSRDESLRPKHVVIACNTATALALPQIRAEFHDMPITGVIDPGARGAVEAAGPKRFPTIGVIGTEATIRSKAYERAIHRRRTQARILLQPTPLLVPMIEEGRDDCDPLVELALKQYLSAMMKRGIDVLVLGCTHYPIWRDAIARMVGETVRVIDSAERCAEDVARRLASAKMLARAHASVESLSRGNSESLRGDLHCFVTDDSPRFALLAEQFVGEKLTSSPTYVSVDELYDAEREFRETREADDELSDAATIG